MTDTTRRTKDTKVDVIYCRTTPRTKRALRIRAAEEGRTIQEVVESAVRVYLKLPVGAAPRMKK